MTTPRIITFYSYKGGTGRTMALANTAWIIASNGLRVLAVDWDLEAPGLHRYFHPFLDDSRLRTSRGVIDMIRDFAAETMRADQPGAGPEWVADRAQVLQYAVSLNWEFPNGGVIDFLPAGVQDPSYSQAVTTFDWDVFYERQGGGAFLRALREDMLANYDVVFIDSRTGLSDTAGICTILLPDVVVDCFTMSTQSIDGAVAVARFITNQRLDRVVRVLPVPMRVERRAAGKAKVSRAYARLRFGVFMRGMAPEELNRYWNDVEIPYLPEYAHEEILAPFGDPPGDSDSLLAAFERLCGALTDGRVTAFQPLDEQVRREWLARFERPALADSPGVLVCHAAADRLWGEWIAAELADAGMEPVRVDVEAVGLDPGGFNEMLAEIGRTVVVVSRDCLQLGTSARIWQACAARDAVEPGSLVPVRVDNAVLTEPFTDRLPLELGDLAEEPARDALLAAVGPPRPEADRHAPPAGGGRRLRFPLSRPPIWKAPLRNPGFVGRHVIFDELRGQLRSGEPAAPVVLRGPAGVGKSQVALEYAHRFAADYDLVWWFSADHARAEYALLHSRLGGPQVAVPQAAVLRALGSGTPYGRWLVIFDGVPDLAAARADLPTGPGHVLVTSRDAGRPEWAETVHVDAFSRDESVALVRRLVPGTSAAHADAIAAAHRDRPLDLANAATWLVETGMAVPRYIDSLGS